MIITFMRAINKLFTEICVFPARFQLSHLFMTSATFQREKFFLPFPAFEFSKGEMPLNFQSSYLHSNHIKICARFEFLNMNINNFIALIKCTRKKFVFFFFLDTVAEILFCFDVQFLQIEIVFRSWNFLFSMKSDYLEMQYFLLDSTLV